MKIYLLFLFVIFSSSASADNSLPSHSCSFENLPYIEVLGARNEYEVLVINEMNESIKEAKVVQVTWSPLTNVEVRCVGINMFIVAFEATIMVLRDLPAPPNEGTPQIPPDT